MLHKIFSMLEQLDNRFRHNTTLKIVFGTTIPVEW